MPCPNDPHGGECRYAEVVTEQPARTVTQRTCLVCSGVETTATERAAEAEPVEG